MKKPNLLFIYTDEQAAATMKRYGNDIIKTPNMDKLAQESIVFENTYVTQPICTPSRSSILTGLYPHTTGCIENNMPLGKDIKCFPELGDFKGYKAAHYGKWHLGDEVFPQHGFHEWKSIEDLYRDYYSDGNNRYKQSEYAEFLIQQGFSPDKITEDGFEYFSREFCARLPEKYTKAAFLGREASEFIKNNKADPFILYVNFLEPHMPFFGPRDQQYDLEEMILPENFHHEMGIDSSLKNRLFKEAYYQNGHSGLPLKTEKDWKRLIANYYGLVSLVDTYLGEILKTLEMCGLFDNTVIVYTSDHGDMMGAHRLLAKSVMFEEAVKVPMLMRIPGMRCANREVKDPVSQIDLVPTLLDVMGQKIPENLEGFSWLPFLKGEGDLVEKDVFIEWLGNNNGFETPEGNVNKKVESSWLEKYEQKDIRIAISDPVVSIVTPDGWKYTHSNKGQKELYNLKEDVYEMKNLYGIKEYEAIVNELESRIIKWKERVGYATNDQNE